MEYNIQKIILDYLTKREISTIINRGLVHLFRVLSVDKYWKIEAKAHSIRLSPLGINYYRKIFGICGDCGKYYAEQHFQYIICRGCKIKNRQKYKSITRNSALINYAVTDEDLSKILHETYSGYIWTGGSRMNRVIYYYLESEVIPMINKQRLKERYERTSRKVAWQRKLVYMSHNEREINKRKTELIEELKKYKLEFMPDSVVCKKYIFGNKEKNIAEVVNKMCTMRYLFEYTDYSNIMGNLLKLPKHIYCFHDSHERRVFAKKQALENIGSSWPETWPWMN